MAIQIIDKTRHGDLISDVLRTGLSGGLKELAQMKVDERKQQKALESREKIQRHSLYAKFLENPNLDPRIKASIFNDMFGNSLQPSSSAVQPGVQSGQPDVQQLLSEQPGRGLSGFARGLGFGATPEGAASFSQGVGSGFGGPQEQAGQQTPYESGFWGPQGQPEPVQQSVPMSPSLRKQYKKAIKNKSLTTDIAISRLKASGMKDMDIIATLSDKLTDPLIKHFLSLSNGDEKKAISLAKKMGYKTD